MIQSSLLIQFLQVAMFVLIIGTRSRLVKCRSSIAFSRLTCFLLLDKPVAQLTDCSLWHLKAPDSAPVLAYPVHK